jgi:hypothetical protein
LLNLDFPITVELFRGMLCCSSEFHLIMCPVFQINMLIVGVICDEDACFVGKKQFFVMLNQLTLCHIWGRSYWCMVFLCCGELCIHIGGTYMKQVHQDVAFVRLFLFPNLFRYSYLFFLYAYNILFLRAVFSFFGYMHKIRMFFRL